MMLVDWNKLVVLLLPVKLRTGTVFGFIRAMVAGLIHIYNTLASYSNVVMYRLSHTSQVWSIEKVLNDSFDPVERRIYITDPGQNDVILINRDTDEPPYVILQDVDGPIIYISGDSAYSGSSYDFIVVLPYQYSQSDLYRIKALVDFYKLAGKRYEIYQNS